VHDSITQVQNSTSNQLNDHGKGTLLGHCRLVSLRVEYPFTSEFTSVNGLHLVAHLNIVAYACMNIIFSFTNGYYSSFNVLMV
jgi:hypothetical protein